MGSGSSRQRMGERVTAGRSKLKQRVEAQDERFKVMMTSSPETLKVAVSSIVEALSLCSPFLEGTLLVAFKAEPQKIEERILRTTEKVLTAPINKDEWQWFQQFVLSSSIWLLRTADDSQFLFQKMIETVSGLSESITAEMNSIYKHLKVHEEWHKVMAIQNETFVARQDHDDVGLLRDDGILGVLEMKQQEDGGGDGEDAHKLKEFVESNLAVTQLAATAKKINSEFQGVMKQIMSRYGEYKPGPIKKVDRCVSKLENDYQVLLCKDTLLEILQRFWKMFSDFGEIS